MAQFQNENQVQELFDYLQNIPDYVWENLEIISEQVSVIGGFGGDMTNSSSRFEVIYYLYINQHVHWSNSIMIARLGKKVCFSPTIIEDLSAKHIITVYKDRGCKYVYLSNRVIIDILDILKRPLLPSELTCLVWIAKNKARIVLLFVMAHFYAQKYIPVSYLYKFIRLRNKKETIFRVLVGLNKKNIIHLKGHEEFCNVTDLQGNIYLHKLYRALVQAFGDPWQKQLPKLID